MLQDEHDLEQGGGRGVSLRLELGDQLLEGEVLVGLGVQGHVPDTVKQLLEG